MLALSTGTWQGVGVNVCGVCPAQDEPREHPQGGSKGPRSPGAAAERTAVTELQPVGINEQLITVIKWYSARGRQHTYIYQLLISSSCLADSCLSAKRRAAACGSRRGQFLSGN